MCYCLQLVEALTSSAYKCLGNVDSFGNTETLVNKMRMSRPVVKNYIQNYHYEKKTKVEARTLPDGKGGTITEQVTKIFWERVNTHCATEEYRYH